jgi:DNA polymerase-3 subunit gamma/tau
MQGGGGGAVRAVASSPAPARAPEPQPDLGPAIASLDDLSALIEVRRDAALAFDIGRYFKPVAFAPGRISFEPAPGAPANLAQRLSGRLKEWTGRPWMITAENAGGGETLHERERRAEAAVRAGVEADPFVRSILDTFPGAEIVKITGGDGPA